MNEDLSGIFEKFNINKDSISPEMINNLMDMLKQNNNGSSDSQDSSKEEVSSNNFGDIDFNTILKMKSVIDKMNVKNDPRSKLLLSLKPYLNQNRQNKLEQYIQMSKIIEILPLIGGDMNASK